MGTVYNIDPSLFTTLAYNTPAAKKKKKWIQCIDPSLFTTLAYNTPAAKKRKMDTIIQYRPEFIDDTGLYYTCR
jgi:hypothetical protein